VHAQFPIAVIEPPKADRVVVILGVVGVDRADHLIRQIEPPRPLHFRIKRIDRRPGLIFHFIRKFPAD
jgi:hypothetical protein